MADIKILNPDALGKPLGQYSHLTRVKASEFVFIAGQVGVDKDGKLAGDGDFDAQCGQTFANIEAALKSVGAGWGNIVRVHHLPGALAGHPEIHGLAPARISQDVRQRRLPAQHAVDDRPPGAGAVAGRGVGGRGALAFLFARDLVRNPVPTFRDHALALSIKLTCAATTRQPSGNFTQVCICRPILPGAEGRS